MHSESIVFAGLMPHAPVLVPSVGHERVAQVSATTRAMRELAAEVLAANPQSVVVLSPHSPQRRDAFGVWRTNPLRGSFELFGSEGDAVELPLDIPLTDLLEAQASNRGLRTWRIAHGTLDHGALVPLHYLAAAGWHGPTAVIGLGDAGPADCERLGEALAAAADALARPVAVIASGDMSHRLTFAAPCGYHPSGSRFDQLFVTRLKTGAADEVLEIDARLCDTAAEDVMVPTRIALAAAAHRNDGRRLLSYEGPFGVGYGVAILFERKPSVAEGPTAAAAHAPPGVVTDPAELPQVARRSVEACLEGTAAEPPAAGSDELMASHGVFVTIHTMPGSDLRGCRGSAIPSGRNVVWSTWKHARQAAFDDGRFAPLTARELPGVRFSVSVLDPLEPVGSAADLDPARYGILVSTIDQRRRGLLLPAIPTVDTTGQQIRLARQKAGIGPLERITIQRFTTRHYREELTTGGHARAQ